MSPATISATGICIELKIVGVDIGETSPSISLNTDGDEDAEKYEIECLSQFSKVIKATMSQIFLASSAFTVENILSRSLLIALSFLFIVYSPKVFYGQTFLKVIA